MAQKSSTKKSSKSSSSKKNAPALESRKVPAKRLPADTRLKTKGKDGASSKAAAKKSLVVELPPKKLEKVRSNLSKSDLQYFRNLLLEKRREILGDVVSMESEAFKGGANLSNMPIHMADVGTDNFEQEFTLGLIESERQNLREIQEALVRIEQGSYGICQGTGKPIPRVRLEAVPWAKYRIEYSRLLESGKIAGEEGASSDDDSAEEDEE